MNIKSGYTRRRDYSDVRPEAPRRDRFSRSPTRSLPKPANDNFRLPANDNTPKKPTVIKGLTPKGIGLLRGAGPLALAWGTLEVADAYFQGPKVSDNPYDMTGWTRTYGPCAYGPLAYTHRYIPQFTKSAVCIAGQAPVSVNYPDIGAARGVVTFRDNYFYSNAIGLRSTVREVWERKGSLNNPKYDLARTKPQPNYNLAPAPNAQPNYQPSISSRGMPIGQFLPEPSALPWAVAPHRQPDTDASPRERSEQSRSPRPSPENALNPLPWLPFPLPVENPVAEQPTIGTPSNPAGTETFITEQFSNQRPPRSGRRGQERRQPPKKGEKEKKFVLNKAVRPIMDIFGKITEGLDVMDAAYKALPKSVKGGVWYDRKEKRWKRKDNVLERAQKVYEHLDLIDKDQFVMNLLDDYFQDWLIGKTSGALDKVLKPVYDKTGTPIGFTGFIPDEVWKNFQDLFGKPSDWLANFD